MHEIFGGKLQEILNRITQRNMSIIASALNEIKFALESNRGYNPNDVDGGFSCDQINNHMNCVEYLNFLHRFILQLS